MNDAMKQATYTPGPWDLSDTIFGDAVYDVTAGSAPPATIGWVCRKQDEDEAEANARLIAAAPELLEAARLKRNTLIHDGARLENGKSFSGDWVAVPREDFDQLRTAIAKAEGTDNA